MSALIKVHYTALIVLLTTLSSLLSDRNPRLSKVLSTLGLLGVPLIYTFTGLLTLPDYQLVLLLLACVVTTTVSLHSTGYYRYMYGATSQVKLVINAVSAVLVLLLSSSTLLELLVYWLLADVMIAFTAITLERGYENIRVSATYLVMSIAPSDVSLLTLWAILAAQRGLYESLFTDIANPGLQLSVGPLLSIVLVFGFSAKRALFPLHSWAPLVYSESPPHVAAIMSGVVSKIGLLGYILASRLFTIDQVAFYTLIAQGVISTAYGAFAAALQTDIRRLLAYSSISYYGIVSSLYALSNLLNASQVYYLVLLIAVYHGILKALAFMNTGLVYQLTNTYNIYRLGDLFYASKWATLSGFLVLANLVGIPPTAGFVVKVSALALSLQLLYENLVVVFILLVLVVHTVFAIMYSAKFLSVYTSALPRTTLSRRVEIPSEETLSEFVLGLSTTCLPAVVLWLLGYSAALIVVYSATVAAFIVLLAKYYRTSFTPEESRYWLTGVES